MPMKKTTFILTFILCISVSSKAQISNNLLLFNTFNTQQQVIPSSDKISNNDDERTPKIILTGNRLTVKNIEVGTQIDIYSILGAKVHSFIHNGEPINLNLNKGIYIVRANKYTQKILFQ